ncbi:MAG: PadR family transcriptional regulator [Anaerolineae bacterium]|nr:PadR family transcriptional regulator [Anaerolineae bacterium]
MSLAHAILGFLSLEPMTGYNLKTACFDDSVAHFWSADQAQIYRTLDKLAEDGFAESHLEVQTDRPNRKVYSITEAGRGELHQWLNSKQILPAHREAFLVQLFFAAELEDQEIIALMEDQLVQHEAKLRQYQEIDLPTNHEAAFWRRIYRFQAMTLDLGKRNEQMYIQWLKDCIAAVRKGS